MEVVKYPKKQDCYYKLLSCISGETSINLSSDVLSFITDNGLFKGEEAEVTFTIYRDDFIQAMCYIFSHMPLYVSSSKGSVLVAFSNNLFHETLESVERYFTDETALYKVTIMYRNDGRIYMKNLNNNGFNIRHFLLEEKSVLKFVRVNHNIELRLRLCDYPELADGNSINESK